MIINKNLIVRYNYQEAKENVKTYDLNDLKVEYANACIKYKEFDCLHWLSYKRLIRNELLKRENETL